MTKTNGKSDPRVAEGIKYATSLSASGQKALAVEHLSALAKEIPQATSLHGYLAIFLSDLNRLQEAVAHARQAVHLSPESEKASLTLYGALSKSGLYGDALDEMKRFLSLKPSKEYSQTIKEWDIDGNKT